MNKDAIEVYFVRNGETQGNLNLQLQGQTEGNLSPKGIEQAELVGKELSSLKFDKIYCSPLGRARQTFVKANLKANPIYLDDLKERDFGQLTNFTYFDMINLAPNKKPGNGESLEDMQKRVAKFLTMLVRENKVGDKILVFAHHEFILSCVAYSIGLPLENFRRMMISNASITQLDYYDGRWVAKRINELGHLNSLKQTKRSY